jgi:hypothetical protein
VVAPWRWTPVELPIRLPRMWLDTTLRSAPPWTLVTTAEPLNPGGALSTRVTDSPPGTSTAWLAATVPSPRT